MNLADLREEYTRGGLQREEMAAEPQQQFAIWFDQARTAELPEPNAFVLSTADAAGRVTSRTVLLKEMDARGFVFYTNYTSEKARQMGENPQVSACFPWFPLERQVVITGTAVKISSTESLKYFLSRPLGSRLGAWTSPQSRIISSRALLEKKLDEMKRKFADGKVPLPDHWGGYRIVPETVEFWQGRPNRLHDRLRYRKVSAGQEPGAWQIERLAP
jgi:pyridoxamine 5'-phosphate oxidase